MNSLEKIREENINDYLSGALTGDELLEFETQIFSDIELEKEVGQQALLQMQEKEHTVFDFISNKENPHNKGLSSDSKRCNAKHFGSITKSLFNKIFGLSSVN